MQDSDIKLNKSKTYLLYYFSETIGIKFFDLLKNTYLYYEGEKKICFLYKYSGNKKFSDFERSLEKNENYVKTIDVSSDKVLYIMNIPEGLDSVIDLFLRGKYSELPEKEELIFFLKSNFGLKDESKIIRIINKDHILKQEIEERIGASIGDLDLSEIPEFDKENFTKKLYEAKSEHDDIKEIDNLQN